jgi:hypothetical protein
MTRRVSRRAVLIGGPALLASSLVACSSGLPRDVPRDDPGPSVSGAFFSKARHAFTAWTIAYPPGHRLGAHLPVLVVLHGRGGDHSTAFDSLHLDRYLAAVVQAGARPFALASVSGGDHEYWHPRRGTDPARMVIDEFVPMLAGRGLRTRRIGLLGWSMGGYGALYLATTLTRARCAVAIAESPAIWHRAEQRAAGAFDDAADFDAHAIFPRIGRLAGIALRVDCGVSDGFAPVTRDLRAAITPTPAGGIEPGAHDASYWRSQAPAQLRFAARHLV